MLDKVLGKGWCVLYGKLPHRESRLIYTGRLCSSSQDIGFYRNVGGGCYSRDFIKEAGPSVREEAGNGLSILWCGIHEIELVLMIHDLLYAWIFPNL